MEIHIYLHNILHSACQSPKGAQEGKGWNESTWRSKTPMKESKIFEIFFKNLYLIIIFILLGRDKIKMWDNVGPSFHIPTTRMDRVWLWMSSSKSYRERNKIFNLDNSHVIFRLLSRFCLDVHVPKTISLNNRRSLEIFIIKCVTWRCFQTRVKKQGNNKI